MTSFLDKTGVETLVSKMKTYVDSKSGGGGVYIIDIVDVYTSGITQTFYDNLVAKVIAGTSISIKYTDYNIIPCAAYYSTTGSSNYTAKTIRLTGITAGTNDLSSNPLSGFVFEINADLTFNLINISTIYNDTSCTALSTTEINNICK